MLYLIAALAYAFALWLGYSYGYSAGLKSARLIIMRDFSIFNENEPESEGLTWDASEDTQGNSWPSAKSRRHTTGDTAQV